MACSIALLSPISADIPFAGDEGHHIWASRYFAHVFLEHNLHDPEFDGSFVGEGHYPWAIDHLMVGRYLIGAWLTGNGYDLYNLPAPYWHNKTLDQNLIEGRVPSSQLLLDARKLPLALSGIILAVVYLLGRVLAGRLAGVAAAVLLFSRPLIVNELLLVQFESMYMLLALAVLLIWIVSVPTSVNKQYFTGRAVIIGVTCGLAVAIKLTASLSIVAMAVWAVLVTLSVYICRQSRRRCGGMRLSSSKSLVMNGNDCALADSPAVACGLRYAGWLVVIVVIALLILIGSDPYIMADPWSHTITIIRYPLTAMDDMSPSFPRDVAASAIDRLRFIIASSVISVRWLRGEDVDPATMALSGANFGLFLTGMISIVRTSWREWCRGQYACPSVLLVITWLVYFIGIAISLGLLWPRYVLPIVLLGTVISGVGLDRVMQCLWRSLLPVRQTPAFTAFGAAAMGRRSPWVRGLQARTYHLVRRLAAWEYCGNVLRGLSGHLIRKMGLFARVLLRACAAGWSRSLPVPAETLSGEPGALPTGGRIKVRAEGNN